METIKIFKSSNVIAILSNDGLTATGNAIKVLNDIKNAAKELGVLITYFDNSARFTYFYQHTVKVPANALKSLEAFKAWNCERMNKFVEYDIKKGGLL